MTRRYVHHSDGPESHSLIECLTCAALLVDEEATERHIGWHRAEAERIERMLDRSESR